MTAFLSQEEAVARKIVDAILDNLMGRKGIGNELEEIDGYIFNEMSRDLKQVVQDILTDAYGM